MVNNAQNPPLVATTSEVGRTIERPDYESYDVEASYFIEDHKYTASLFS